MNYLPLLFQSEGTSPGTEQERNWVFALKKIIAHFIINTRN